MQAALEKSFFSLARNVGNAIIISMQTFTKKAAERNVEIDYSNESEVRAVVYRKAPNGSAALAIYLLLAH